MGRPVFHDMDGPEAAVAAQCVAVVRRAEPTRNEVLWQDGEYLLAEVIHPLLVLELLKPATGEDAPATGSALVVAAGGMTGRLMQRQAGAVGRTVSYPDNRYRARRPLPEGADPWIVFLGRTGNDVAPWQLVAHDAWEPLEMLAEVRTWVARSG